MNKKGFTLIELLAIIAILAIIAVITVPQILNIVSSSKKETAKDSAFGYKNAIHQYYLTESANNSELDMNGDYSIENGVISNGAESFNIGITGQTPTSGEVTISNGEVVDGCIVYGDYSVVIENGNVVDTRDGGCYNISYFTYDSSASLTDSFSDNEFYGKYGYFTSNVSTPDPSWEYYIKEIEVPYKYTYGIYGTSYEEYDGVLAGLSNIEICQQYIIDEYGEYADSYECRSFGTYKKYELYIVVEGDQFHFKLGDDVNSVLENYNNNIGVLNTLKSDYNMCAHNQYAHEYDVFCGVESENEIDGIEMFIGYLNIDYSYDHYSATADEFYGCGIAYNEYINDHAPGNIPSIVYCGENLGHQFLPR